MSRRTWRPHPSLAWAALGLLFMVLPAWLGNYHLFVLQRVMLFAMLALGLNLFMGYCGQVNFGVSGLFALGAYGSGILEVRAGLNPFVTIVPAVVIGAVVSYLLSKIFLRLRHMSLALGTVAFALTLYVLLRTAVPRDWGGGDSGFSLPRLTVFGHSAGYVFNYYYVGIWLAVTLLACALVVSSRVGRAWEAIRDDEAAAAACGINVAHYKTVAFVLNGVVASLAGVVFAHQARYISPDNFDLFSNILILLIVIVGGTGSNEGMVIGSLLIVVLGEFVANVQNFPTLFYGLVLFLVVRFLPRGIWFHLRDGARWLGKSLVRPAPAEAQAETGTVEAHPATRGARV